ncbi:MAG: hypothetical protein RL748_4386 [Pseudomonadota bacterium]|jgi:hypothetical protein
MKKQFPVAATLAACTLSLLPLAAFAADTPELAEIRSEIKQMRESYEARLKALEQKLAQEQEKNARLQASAPAAAPTAPAAASASVAGPGKARTTMAGANQFNPAISLILSGTYANLSQDPETYRLPGSLPGSRIASEASARGFGIGESELTMSAAIDPHFSGQITFALDGNEAASVEEAFVDAKDLGAGVNMRVGRFFSSLGYQNSQHAHAWDFVDAPLAYQSLLGGQASTDGVQLKWLAPLDRFLQFGAEFGKNNASQGSKNGISSGTLFAHLGDDIGSSGSWRLGASYWQSRADDLEIGADDINADGASALVGQRRAKTWVLDGVFKWAPDGNATRSYFKLQGEYLRRTETGNAALILPDESAGDSASYRSRQSGWYLQGIYQFSPNWRTGVRYDRLGLAQLTGASLPAGFLPDSGASARRTSLMLDWNRSEFSRIRLQLTRDKARSDVVDNQIFLQYIMSLGAHGAHSF